MLSTVFLHVATDYYSVSAHGALSGDFYLAPQTCNLLASFWRLKYGRIAILIQPLEVFPT